MTNTAHAPRVGAQDPELRNSPILQESDEEFEVLEQEANETPACYFNGTPYRSGEFVCSGTQLLCCDRGVWRQTGTCDPDHAP